VIAIALAYLNERPYCDTFSKPFFQTRVTSHALVAESLHDIKAETAFPPTTSTLVSCCLGCACSTAMMVWRLVSEV
jgi:hypothetical protein